MTIRDEMLELYAFIFCQGDFRPPGDVLRTIPPRSGCNQTGRSAGDPRGLLADGGGKTSMSADTQASHLTPFPPDYRACGVLLHVTSLPSPYGIGDLGRPPSRGSTAFAKRARRGGKHSPWVPPDMPIHHTNPCLPSPATGF